MYSIGYTFLKSFASRFQFGSSPRRSRASRSVSWTVGKTKYQSIMSWQSLETRDSKKTYQSSFLMIVKEKIPSGFEEHTLQFTLKIALNIEMQSNLFILFQRSGKPGTRPDSISIWLHEKDRDVRRKI